MAPTPQLSPPGSSSYFSNSMFVGDGTWDSQRNTFLLPNLVGLNFDTMRYNGMGNRFRDLPQYHSLILGHGVIAAIVFIFIVPIAIMMVRFQGLRQPWALRLHIWLQVVTVALTTVLFVLGWFAVGPSRSLTNPHHGIGLAIYVLVLAQAIGGWYVYSREKGKVRNRLPLKLMVHQWSGRFIALLGLAQVPLGLTLYGSPRSLFVLYALAVFALLLFYFVLSYQQAAPPANFYRESNDSGTVITEDRHHHSGLGAVAGATAAATAAGAGLAALNRHRHRGEPVGGDRHSGSFIEEKITHGESGGFMKRVLEGGTALGSLAFAKKFFDGRKDKKDSHYEDTVSDDSDSRSEEARAVGHGRANTSPGQSYSGSPRSSRSSLSDRRRGHGKLHKAEEGVATLGALGLLRAAIKGRRERKEQRRIDTFRAREMEEERNRRRGDRGGRYTGDGQLPRRSGRRGSLTSTDYTATTAPHERHNHHPHHHHHGIPPAVPAAAAGAVAGAALAGRDRHRDTPPLGSTSMPPGPSDPTGIFHEYSGSEGHRPRPHGARDLAVASTAAGAAASAGHHSGAESGVASPPVSVKVKMHNDGRHVTLRRLSEQEAAAEREARERDRSRNSGSKHHSRHRRGSGSELSAAGAGSSNWRRVESLERRQAEAEAERQAEAGPGTGAASSIPPPPMPMPPPEALVTPGPPPTYDGHASEVTGAPRSESNRRRRRAERSQHYREGSQVDWQ